jgi:hypothetical protein
MSLGLGLGLGMTRAAAIDIWQRKLKRSWVAWRDGSMAGSGATGGGAINPRTGVVETGPMVMDFMGLRFGFAWDAITNLVGAISLGGGLGSNTLNAATLERTIVEDGATGPHYANCATFAVVDGANYRVVVGVRRISGTSRHALLMYSTAAGGQGVRVAINMDTGALTTVNSGTGALASVSASAAPGGGWIIDARFAVATWGANATVFATISNNPIATSLPSYAGDGASGLVLTGTTWSTLTDSAPRLAEGITRTADSWIWTTPAAVPQNAEITHLLMQPYADGDMGITAQTWLAGGTAGSSLIRGGATSLGAWDYDGTDKNDLVTRTLPSRATLCIQRHIRRAADIEAGYGAALSGSPTAGSSWQGNTTLRIGRGSAAGRASRAANAVILTPGGCTQAERVAETILFHQRPVALVA